MQFRMKTKFIGFLTMCVSLTFLGCTSSNENNYKEAVRENDFNKAHECLSNIHEEFANCWDELYPELDSGNNYRDEITVKASRYSEAATYVLGAEIRYLMSTNSEEAATRIKYLFNELEDLRGDKGTGKGYHPHGVKSHQQECLKLDCYKETAKCNNALCDIVVDLAILNDNKELAEYALTHYMEKWELDEYKDVIWNNSDLSAAGEKLRNAVQNGAFQ